MADISESKLKDEIHAFLKTANLANTSTKKVIIALEKKLGVELKKRKDEIDKIVMDYVNSIESEEESEKEEKKKKKKKEEESESESESESDEKTKRKTRGGGGTKSKKAAAAKPKRAGGTKGKGTGFTRSYKLSPALSELMGADEMPRHAVVKRIWALVKENQMFDPNNKQFAICDDALFKVIGKPRFRVFGMMKYLKNHFIAD